MFSIGLEQRRIRDRPARYDERLRETLFALRYVRVKDDGQVRRAVDEARVAPGEGVIWPSFAVLQLYMMNDSNVLPENTFVGPNVYVEQPIVLGDNARTSANLRSMAASFLALSLATGDISRDDNLTALRTPPRLYDELPNVYAGLRSITLYRLEALWHITDANRTVGAVVNNRLLDIVFERWVADTGKRDGSSVTGLSTDQTASILRAATRIENRFKSDLESVRLSQAQAAQRLSVLIRAVRTEIYPVFRAYTVQFRFGARPPPVDKDSPPSSPAPPEPDEPDPPLPELPEDDAPRPPTPPLPDVAGEGETLTTLPDEEDDDLL
jgi:hypothetical protein